MRSIALMSGPGPNDAQAAYWEDRAGSWVDAEPMTQLMLGGVITDTAIGRLAPVVGEDVLDIGCGPGPTTMQIAAMVRPVGRVTGADISPTMVSVARTRARDAGLGDVSFVVADAQSADLGTDVYDAAFSRFGVMFFADPVAAFANVARALRPGGRLVFACWQDVSRNEWLHLPGAAAVAVSGRMPELPETGSPGPFSLSDPDRIRAILDASGYVDVTVEDLTVPIVIPEDRIEVMIDGARRMGVLREQLDWFHDDPELSARIVDAVRAELVGRVRDGELRLTSSAWIVSAVVPSGGSSDPVVD